MRQVYRIETTVTEDEVDSEDAGMAKIFTPCSPDDPDTGMFVRIQSWGDHTDFNSLVGKRIEVQVNIIDEQDTDLDRIYELVKGDFLDDSIDIVFDKLDEYLCAGEFSRVDDFLDKVDINRLDCNLIVAVLSITFQATEELKNWDKFFDVCEELLREKYPERFEGMLKGFNQT